MSDGPTFELPRHVEMAAIDEDVRVIAAEGARFTLRWCCVGTEDGRIKTNEMWRDEPTTNRAAVARALRVLRHYGLLVEHGDGVVSVKETPNG